MQIKEFATLLVKEAANKLKYLRQNSLEVAEKQNHADLVTMADPIIEELLVKRILERYPKHSILGEEGGPYGVVDSVETVWVIDPIDGTTNFIHGLPFFGISVAVIHKGEGIVGIVYNPTTDELFVAEKGNGLTVNGKKIKMQTNLQLRDTLISTTMFWADNKTKEAIHPSVIHLYKKSRGVRMLGGAAVTLSELAKGAFGIYYMPMLKAWDYAAGAIIVQEAGGMVTTLDGASLNFTQNSGIIAAHPALYDEVASWF